MAASSGANAMCPNEEENHSLEPACPPGSTVTEIYSYTPPSLKSGVEVHGKFRKHTVDSGYDSENHSMSTSTESELSVPADGEKDAIISMLRHKLHHSELHNSDLMEEIKQLQDENEELLSRVNKLSKQSDKSDSSFLVQSWIASPGSSDVSGSAESPCNSASLKVELTRARLDLLRLEDELRDSAEERYSITKAVEMKEKINQELEQSLKILQDQLLETVAEKEQLEAVVAEKENELESLARHCQELTEIASQRRPVNELATPPGLIKYFCPDGSADNSMEFREEPCQNLGSEVIDLQLQEAKVAREDAEQKLNAREEELNVVRKAHAEVQLKLQVQNQAIEQFKTQTSNEIRNLKRTKVEQTVHLQVAQSAGTALERSVKHLYIKLCTLALGPKREKRNRRSLPTMTDVTFAELSSLYCVRAKLSETEQLVNELRAALKCEKENAAKEVEHARLLALKESESRVKRAQAAEEDFKCMQANRATLAEARCMQLEQEVDNLTKKLDQLNKSKPTTPVHPFQRRASLQFSPPVAVQKRCECIRFNRRQQQFSSKDDTIGNKSLVKASDRRATFSPKAVKDTLPHIPLAVTPELKKCKKLFTPPRAVKTTAGSSSRPNSNRVSELTRRNSMVLPHMKSCYPSEYIVLNELEVENVFKPPDPVPKVRTGQILRDTRNQSALASATVRRPATASDIPGERSSRRPHYPLR